MVKKIHFILSFLLLTYSVNAQTLPVSGGVAAAYTLTMPSTFSLKTGITIKFQANVTCAASATINVNSTGNVAILAPNGSNIGAGAITVNQVVEMVYDGGSWQMISSPGNAASSANTWDQNGNAVTAEKSMGTTSNYDLPFITNNIERMRLNNSGSLGLGTSSNQIIGKFNVRGSDATANGVDGIFVDVINGSGNIAGSLAGIRFGNYNADNSNKYIPGGILWKSNGGAFGAGDMVFVTGSAGGTANTAQTRMIISDAGNVGIGSTNTPLAKLDVTGQMYSRSYNAGAGSNIDWNNGNNQITSTGTSTITLSNMQDGGEYNLYITNGTSTTYTFSQGSLVFLYTPPNGATTSGQTTLYLFNRVGNIVYVDWKTIAASPSAGWNLTGNTGTTAGTNFIGTTDAQGFSIKTTNTERMRIDASGNVGIGTSTPQYNFHIAGTQAMSLLQTSNVSNNSILTIGRSRGTVAAPTTPLAGDLIGEFVFTAFDGTNFYNEVASINSSLSENSTGTASGGYLSLKTTPIGSNVSLDRVRITSAGDVGIGSVSPNARLHVMGLSSVFNSNLLELEGDYSSLGDYQQLNFARVADGNSITSIRSVFDNAGQYSLDFYGTTAGSPLSTSIMRMQGDGNVGIGTTNPDTKLHVSTTGNAYIQAESQTSATPVGIFLNSPTRKWYLLNQTGGSDRISFYDATAIAERLVIDGPTGNVGIGTGSPNASALLELNSTSKGLLIPQVALTTTTTSGAVASPATGLVVYNTATAGSSPTNVLPGYYYNSGTPGAPVWKRFSTGNGDGWGTTGNAGTTAGTNFIGTTDNISLTFKVNSIRSGLLDQTYGQTFYGYNAGAANINTASTNNTAVGASAMGANTYASQNVAIGKDALLVQSFGNGSVVWATNNVAIGYGAMRLNQPTLNTNGYQNTAVGAASLGNNTTGSNNAALGKDALLGNTTGSSSTAVGASALATNSTGGSNTALGFGALTASTTASSNTAVGALALSANVTAPDNTAVGTSSLQGNTYGSQNVAIGRDALLTQSFANASTVWATNNVAIGYRALRLNQPTANTNGYQNTAVGALTLAANTTGLGNTAIGYNTLTANNTGQYNTATGHSALSANTSGGDNAAYGINSMLLNQTGIQNAAYGAASLQNNLSGNTNVADGRSALYSNTVGSSNTASGSGALFSNVAGSNATAVGFGAMYYSNSTATGFTNFNVAVGYEALKGSVTAASNTGNNNNAIGYQSLFGNTVGANNVAEGYFALNANTASSDNVAIGYNAMATQSFANAGIPYSGQNTAIGSGALYSNQPTTTSTGWNNTAIGWRSLYLNTTGIRNVATGTSALGANVKGDNNTASGVGALGSNTYASDNVAVGYGALSTQAFINASASWSTYNTAVGENALLNNNPTSNANGMNNTALGYYALVGNTIGTNNTGVGVNTGNALNTGSNNVLVGMQAGTSGVALTSGSNNTFIGYQAQTTLNSINNATAIGNGASVTSTNNMVFGNASVVGWGFGVAPGAAAIKVGTGPSNGNGATLTVGGVWTSISDSTKKYDINNMKYGLAEVMKLRPVTYKLKGTSTRDVGFLAQEVKLIIPEVVYGQEGDMSMSYAQITSVLTKAMQEQQQLIEELKLKVKAQNSEIDKLKADNSNLDKKRNSDSQKMQSEIDLIKAQLGIGVEVKK